MGKGGPPCCQHSIGNAARCRQNRDDRAEQGGQMPAVTVKDLTIRHRNQGQIAAPLPGNHAFGQTEPHPQPINQARVRSNSREVDQTDMLLLRQQIIENRLGHSAAGHQKFRKTAPGPRMT